MASELKKRFENYLIVNRLAPKTQEAYLSAVTGLANYHNVSPDLLTNEQVQDYLVHLMKHRGLAWNTCNVALCALNSFYIKFLGRSQDEYKIPPRPREHTLPEVLSKKQVFTLIDHAKDLRARTFLMLVYGSGLRVSEAVILKPRHIESDRMLVRLEQAKGRKDRYSLLAKKALEELRLYYKVYRPEDYLFFGRDKSEPLPVGSAQKMYYHAKRNAGITKGRGIHTLRHCFATHLLMQGVDIQLIKEFLGHNSIETTLIYLHMVPDRAKKIGSPLDHDDDE
jgi:integrase/recombinase XerD